MAQRHIHYEAAFEDYIRSRGWPYIPVDEHRKALFHGARVKSFDFLLYRATSPAWLVEIKGRKFPYHVRGATRYWENWVAREDLDDMAQWQGVFGEQFRSVLIFAYWLLGLPDKDPSPEIHTFRDQHYAFLCVPTEEYARHARPRSASWNTVSVPVAEFRRLARPIHLA